MGYDAGTLFDTLGISGECGFRKPNPDLI